MDDFDDMAADAEGDRGFQDGANHARSVRKALEAEMRKLRGDSEYEDYYNEGFWQGFYDAI